MQSVCIYPRFYSLLFMQTEQPLRAKQKPERLFWQRIENAVKGEEGTGHPLEGYGSPDRASLGEEGDDQCDEEAYAADQRFHDGPGLEGGLFIHSHKALDQPEAGVVEVRADGGAARNGRGDAGQIQGAERADAGHGGDDA